MERSWSVRSASAVVVDTWAKTTSLHRGRTRFLLEASTLTLAAQKQLAHGLERALIQIGSVEDDC